MLYVFHVDVGRMLKFDMQVALSSVEKLKETIERLHGIPAASIVLLVSGGEMLTECTQVAYYSAGTDTNPIYMFLKGDAEATFESAVQTEKSIDLRDQVELCMEMPAVYETVSKRALLALRMYETASDEERLCESLVHEQHLQQQGWSAVVANMEDLTEEFKQRFQNFCTSFDRHMDKRNSDLELLRSLKDDLDKLARIPILPGLKALAQQDFHAFDDALKQDEGLTRAYQQQALFLTGAAAIEPDNTNTNKNNETIVAAVDTETTCETSDDKSSSTSPNKKLKMGTDSADEQRIVTSQTSNTSAGSGKVLRTLLDWITARDNTNSLYTLANEATQGMDTFTANVYEKLKLEVQNIIKLAEQADVKEIKGLGERLCRLEEFKYKIKNMVQDQKELSTAFQQNQSRANILRDPSILPDLCASHKSQLLVMLQNHHKIREHRRCIAKAKDELGNNLYTRVKRIVCIENSLRDIDNRLLFYHRYLKRSERHLKIIEQVHQAPCIYVAAVTEVVRRKIFSGEFCIWASKLAEDFDVIHSEEISRRQTFNASFDGHFLNILFPGMNDMPPAFAGENPLMFDTRLPNLTTTDIDVLSMLSAQLPNLAPGVHLPDMGPVINFFVSRSGIHQKERLEELLKQQVEAALNTTFGTDKPLQNQRLSELQKDVVTSTICEESETDTETEFEKLPVSAVQTVATSTSENMPPETVARSTITEQLIMQSAETLTDENESAARAEVQQLRSTLSIMSKASMDCIGMARVNLSSIREDATQIRDDLQSELQMLNEKWKLINMQCVEREQQLQQKNAENTCELQQMQAALEQRTEEMEKMCLQVHEMESMQEKCNEMQAQMNELREQLEMAERVKEKAVAEAREVLIHEHKSEIESLRCRFKLMTSMEHSPTESSLDIMDQRMNEMTQHEAMMAQLRAKELALEAERAKMYSMNSESVMHNASILKELLEEKERQLEQFREKVLILTKENFQLKSQLVTLTNEEGNSWMKEKIDYMNKDKSRLEEELKMEKSRRFDMESSFAALRASNIEQLQGILPRSKSSGSSHKYVVLESCSKGDIVFVAWSVRHAQYMVVQDSQSLYFVHGDSLAALNLRLPTTAASEIASKDVLATQVPLPYYAIGRVVDKEYCQAKKEENRYRVTRGSKFYRIKLAPIKAKYFCPALIQSSTAASSSIISRSVLQSEAQSEAAAGTAIVAFTTAPEPSGTAKDCADYSGSVAGVTIASTSSAAIPLMHSSAIAGIFRDRTISVTSVTEEDEEPVSLLSERCRYISVSEEDEPAAAIAAASDTPMTTTTAILQQQQEQSVITEQPTASSTLELNLLLASADIITPPQLQQQQQKQHEHNTVETPTELTTSQQENNAIQLHLDIIASTLTGTLCTDTITTSVAMPPIYTGSTIDNSSPTIPISIATTSEDSDEYRSLEAKDDADFTICE